ncbi:OmpL47-type beta-barrel domain-containing protein [Naasia sp. SYSU D00948]|uniref:OmpL47-type beta-barrel domain-containing protein n=1 Tax=Naasia sp. SYSU D00948 TaxID=2817379 RepID=UPI001B316AED|nr:PxKF domain-containing protein [Naasia sp. SYSU D00948]
MRSPLFFNSAKAAEPNGRRRPLWLAVLAVLAVLFSTFNAPVTAAIAADVASARFTGGTGTLEVGGVLYAKSGSPVTLTVTTPAGTKCVDVAGAHTARQVSATAKTTWTFNLTAPAGEGGTAVTVAATGAFNNNDRCTTTATNSSAFYVRDNTGPVVTSAITPTPNAAGWNNADVTVAWTATDLGGGVGVAGTQPFRTNTVTSNGVTDLTTLAQADRLGNLGAPGSVTVRVDKAAPTITATQTTAGFGQPTTVTFTCADSNSGGGQSSGIASCVADGTNPASSSITVTANGTVTGTATDRAGNTTTTSVEVRNVDTTAPTLSGAPTTQPNGNGWYAGDVAVKWTAADPESGIPTPPANTLITGEGSGLTSSTTVSNGAGLSTTATSSPAVNIDRTAPTTGISGASNTWVNGSVNVSLTPTDGLSGVASTSYTIDGGAAQTGTRFTLSTEGEHTVTYFSVDKAGNAEAPRTATILIDRTAPTIGHTFAPSSYSDGAWTNGAVTVTFVCEDQGGSGVAGCTAPVTKSAEGSHTVGGTATDGAGNTATDSATVNIDTTAPQVSASVTGTPNEAGWYNEDVTVTYSATDALSGVTTTSAPTVLTEGADRSATGEATDAAGNTGRATVSGIDIDRTAPVLKGTFAAGWHTGDVTVSWTCTDALSGVAAGPSDTLVSGEGANLSSTATCVDVAGNAATTTVSGIKIDRAAPTTTGSVSGVGDSGWATTGASVTLTASDNLSGVAATHYTVNDGAQQTYTGPIAFVEDGEYTVEFWSVDNAGLVEKAGAPVDVRVDRTAPVTTVIDPISPASGWFVTSGIPVAFAVVETGSGVAATYYRIDGGAQQTYGERFEAELGTGTHTIEYWTVDNAGNAEAKRSFTVKVDVAPPTIRGSQSPAANGAGWNNTPVDVIFTCEDADSGIAGVAGCAGDTTLANSGANQTVRGDAVDVAGNRNAVEYGPVNIDMVKPTLVGVPSDPNGAGWYNTDVTVKWVGDDALSGIDSGSQPADSRITGEGANLGAGPVTIRDRAGNTSEPASVSGIRIDRTAPVVTGAPTTRPNAAGWYTGEVTVDFACTDSLSGVASCPTSVPVRGNGGNQSATSDPATDVAGNASARVTVDGINIDGQAPSTTSNNTCTAENGYCKGETANIVLTAVDQAGLSGVREIRYVVNGGAEQVHAGASATVSVLLSGTGAASVRYWAVDNAGNAEPANAVALKWDNIAPTVTHVLNPAPNADDWNNSDVTVTFSAKDDDHGSGVASTTAPVTVSTETAGKVVTGTAKDTAGNVGTDSVTVKLDKTAPSITGAITSGTKTASGWYSGPVTVTFTCSDALSGVATCPDPVILSANGANTATGKVTDKAGNTATATVTGINIDQEKPTLTTADVNVQGGTFTLGKVPAATCTATDSFSGLASCTVTVSGGNANGVGTFTYTATATDKVGNKTTITGTYRVIYRFDGFLQPINDTAHQVGASTSIFKAGSTVPAKFQLKKDDGTVVQAATAPVWLTPVKGSTTTAPVDETVYTASADSGTTYRYDSAAQQYLYNWKTGTGGNYWRVGVKLDDGQTYFVNIGLR